MIISGTFGQARETLDLAQLTAANTNVDGTGTMVDLKTGAGNGSYINSVDFSAVGTTTAGAIRIFLYDLTNTRFVDEVIVPPITPSTTLKRFVTTWVPPSGPIKLPSGWKLKASTHNAETFNATVKGGDFN